jgi:hypothetical protein
MRLEGLRQLKNPVVSSGIKSADLAACCIVLQPTTLPRDPRHTLDVLQMCEFGEWLIHVCVEKLLLLVALNFFACKPGLLLHFLKSFGAPILKRRLDSLSLKIYASAPPFLPPPRDL